jgi:hypothetical protein
MSSTFGCKRYQHYDGAENKPKFDLNAKDFYQNYKDLDLVVMSFWEPSAAHAGNGWTTLGGMVHGMQTNNSFKVAMFAPHSKLSPLPSESDGFGQEDYNLWLNLTEEQREAILPIKVPMVDNTGRSILSRRSNFTNPVMSFTRGFMVRMGR